MHRLSELQARVYFVIRNHGPIGPTKIGHHLEFAYEQASGSVTRPLRTLVRRGLVEKIKTNNRVVHYRVIHENTPPLVLTEDSNYEDN